ncbi:MAG: biotin--[acetyl-CoA-carboxylase] ligase [Oscillospiraceae bacterium]|nr:biotin--[acetyl-CoA-carboxylase] ligase [Oscillospiraceae bacterium]
MTSKSRVLSMLEGGLGEYLSGEELARQLGISRTAVWKSIEELRRDGYVIEAVTRRGYRLAAGTDVLSAEGIGLFLRPCAQPWQVVVLDTVGSTNRAMRERAQAGAPNGLVLAAEGQSEGRGRFGRPFFSPPGCGIYFSVLLRPRARAEAAALLTAGAAVAVCRAVQKLAGVRLQIKWVNDLLLEGKKVCGILTEAATDLESGSLEYVVLGVGLNYSTAPEQFPPELQGVASSLFPGGRGCPEGLSRNRLTAEILLELSQMLEDGLGRGCLAEYRERSAVLGREVWVLRDGGEEKGMALEIDGEGRLVIRREDGGEEALRSGEVSLRPIK